MNQFIHVCVGTRKSSVQDRSDLAMSVLCVTLTCCSCNRHWKYFQCLRVFETIVPFALIDLKADKSPAHKVSILRWDRCHTHMNTINGLTFFPLSYHTGMLCNALVSVPQLSGVMLILATDISNRVRRIQGVSLVRTFSNA